MKDLYRRIGLSSQTDDRAAIERALSSSSNSNPASVRAARHILLDSDRKVVYDRTREIVLRIGQLRANLGLSRAPNGLATDCGDFEVCPSSPSRQPRAVRPRSNGPQGQRRPDSSRRIGRWVALVITTVVLCLGIIGALSKDRSPRTSRGTFSSPSSLGTPASWQQPSATPIYTTPQSPVESRADKVRKLVKKRLERVGIVLDSSTIDVAVEKLIQGRADPLPATGVLTRNFYGEGVSPPGDHDAARQ